MSPVSATSQALFARAHQTAREALQQRLAAMRRAHEDALQPLRDQLATHRLNADALEVERKKAELLAGDFQKAAEARQRAEGAEDPAAQAERVADAKKRGEELAQGWLDGFNRWMEAGGGTMGGAIKKSLEDWYATTGRPTAERIGQDLGTAIAEALSSEFARRWELFLKERTGIAALEATLRRLRGEGPEGGSGGGGSGFGGPPPPLVSPQAQATVIGAGGAPGAVTIDVGGVRVEAAAGSDPQQIARQAGEAVAQEVLAALTSSAATTDPGASTRLQGNHR